jgi:hypothetical protein
MNAEVVTKHYLIAALWSSTDEHGEPLDAVYSLDDIAPEAQAKALEDCADFIQSCGEALEALNPEQVGHDFWLTRNHHGTGFWDRGLGALGDHLTKMAQAYSECDAVIGDDGLIYLEG